MVPVSKQLTVIRHNYEYVMSTSRTLCNFPNRNWTRSGCHSDADALEASDELTRLVRITSQADKATQTALTKLIKRLNRQSVHSESGRVAQFSCIFFIIHGTQDYALVMTS